MAKMLSIFIGCQGDLDGVAVLVNQILGETTVPLSLQPNRLYSGVVLGVDFRLFDDHGLEDDMGINFTQYNLELDMRALDSLSTIAGFDVMYHDIALFLAAAISAKLGSPTLVVSDLQREVARFDAVVA